MTPHADSSASVSLERPARQFAEVIGYLLAQQWISHQQQAQKRSPSESNPAPNQTQLAILPRERLPVKESPSQFLETIQNAEDKDAYG